MLHSKVSELLNIYSIQGQGKLLASSLSSGAPWHSTHFVNFKYLFPSISLCRCPRELRMKSLEELR